VHFVRDSFPYRKPPDDRLKFIGRNKITPANCVQGKVFFNYEEIVQEMMTAVSILDAELDPERVNIPHKQQSVRQQPYPVQIAASP